MTADLPASARLDPPTPPSSPPPAHTTPHPATHYPDIDSNYDSDDDQPPPFHHLFTLGRRIRRRQTDDESETPPRPTPPLPDRRDSKMSTQLRLKNLGAVATRYPFSPFRRASADDASMPQLATVISAPSEDTGSDLPASVPMAKSLSSESNRYRVDLPIRSSTLGSPLRMNIPEGSNSSTSPRLSDQTDTTLVRPSTPPPTRPPAVSRRSAPGKLKMPRPSSLITSRSWFDAGHHVTEPEPVALGDHDVFNARASEKPRRKRRRFPQARMPPTPGATPRPGGWSQSNRSSVHSTELPLGEGSLTTGARTVGDRQRRFMGNGDQGPPSPMSQPFQSATDYGFGVTNEKEATSSHGDGQLWRLVTCGFGGRGRAKALRARRRVRKEAKPEDWRTRLRKWFIVDGYVTLYIRVVTLACAITSLGEFPSVYSDADGQC